MTRIVGGLVGAVVALVVASPIAGAAPTFPRGYTAGGIDSAIGINCTSIAVGSPREETQVTATAAAQGSAKRRAGRGKVFYARALVGIVGTTCNGATVDFEVIPPKGVDVAYGREHPYWIDYSDDPDPPSSSSGRDALRASRGRFGGVSFRAFYDGRLQPWPLANTSGPLEIHVPLKARRTLSGTVSRRPRCRAQGSGQRPCSRTEARDHLQVVVNVGAAVGPTLLVADVGLFARSPRRG